MPEITCRGLEGAYEDGPECPQGPITPPRQDRGEVGAGHGISPVTGERKPAGTHATGNYTGATFPAALTQFFKTPGFWEDAVLHGEGVEDPASKVC